MFIQRKLDGKRFWKILSVLGFGKLGKASFENDKKEINKSK